LKISLHDKDSMLRLTSGMRLRDIPPKFIIFKTKWWLIFAVPSFVFIHAYMLIPALHAQAVATGLPIFPWITTGLMFVFCIWMIYKAREIAFITLNILKTQWATLIVHGPGNAEYAFKYFSTRTAIHVLSHAFGVDSPQKLLVVLKKEVARLRATVSEK